MATGVEIRAYNDVDVPVLIASTAGRPSAESALYLPPEEYVTSLQPEEPQPAPVLPTRARTLLPSVAVADDGSAPGGAGARAVEGSQTTEEAAAAAAAEGAAPLVLPQRSLGGSVVRSLGDDVPGVAMDVGLADNGLTELPLPPPNACYFESHFPSFRSKPKTKPGRMPNKSTEWLAPVKVSFLTATRAKAMAGLIEKTRAHLPLLDNDPGAVARSLMAAYTPDYPYWRMLLAENNLCLYGLGSRSELALRFASWLAAEEAAAGETPVPTVVINGASSQTSASGVLGCILEEVFGVVTRVRVAKGVDIVRKCLRRGPSKLRLVVLGIDAKSLQGQAAQGLICGLAELRGVSLIATLDHMSGPVLWGSERADVLAWAYIHAPTYAPSIVPSAEIQTKALAGGVVTIEGVRRILASVTPNSRAVFDLVLESVAGGGPRTRKGISLANLLAEAQSSFLTSDERSLRAQLREFVEHGMIAIRSQSSGDEVVVLLDHEVVAQLLGADDDDDF
ncbi:uncharacterized protein AMSG_03564 [Thecamonas trahens ATCC 50062]|uniref:Origin recognition complex subunit 2 n=1 Tax=Thecamonas trahens ATCC 50062 TaxID=461836 RepID=A0A0L0D4H7_THETB|nr:hypothetical protein AMSG_03564 [Thecamonas trahens ATCC 50062]KNC47135.1 hypothetical protein AMSG_03564 [Thecamonas trahens ATCC 50062]|eukprot:XP_013759911.1 hypothetical protein AMSG_03564 [Thecamonas trahens ATCC 50062]